MLKAYFFQTDEWNNYGDIIIADNSLEKVIE